MTELNRELQSLSPSAFVELFELNLARVGGQTFRFCSNTNLLHTDIVWQGQTYVRLPIEVDGFDRTSNGSLPRPVMRVSNLQGAMAALARENEYFLGCKLTRKRTFARFLDSANYPPIPLPAPQFVSRASTATYVRSGLLYTAAVDEARYTYDSAGVANGLFLEPLATNRARQSNLFTSPGWRKNGVTPVLHPVLPPMASGTQSYKLEEQAVGGAPFYIEQTFSGFLEGQLCTWSTYLRASYTDGVIDRRFVALTLSQGSDIYLTVYVNLESGAVSGVGSETAKVTALANGWFRVAVSAMIPPGSGGFSVVGNITMAKTVGEVMYSGEMGKGVYLFGAQMEQGPSATSYIPSAQGVAVRAEDVYITSLPGNPEADPTQHLPDEVWFVDRKAAENKMQMDFELASALDMQGVMLPKRQIVQNCCAWVYRSSECSYTGGPVAKEDGTPTSDPAEDKCGRRLSDCKKRFTEGALPYGGFPGCGLVR